MSIMIVDDSEPFRLAVSILLQEAGYGPVVSVESGKIALETLSNPQSEKHESVDIILLDLNMPEMDGIAATQIIKAHKHLADIPIIMISTEDQDKKIAQAFAVGAQDYIRKPIHKLELKARVATVLRLRQETIARKHREQELEESVESLRKAITQVKTLNGLLPICSHCKKIRDDNGYWTRVEQYIAEHSCAEFTHGVCPDCADRYYPEIMAAREVKTAH